MTTTTSALPAPDRLAWPSLIWIGAIHLGALLAFVPAYFSWSGLALCFFLHWLTGGIGICMTYHRLLTHRSFAVRPRWLEYVLTVIGACASEGGPIGWVADHRKHHAHSDEEDDTHTPLRGFLWAHMYWWMRVGEDSEHTPEFYQKWCPDLYKDPVHRWLERYHFVFPLDAVRRPVRRRRDELAGLGGLCPNGLRAALDLAGQFGEPCVGLSLASHARSVDEPVVGRPSDLRRRLAQQSSRLPDFRPSWTAMVGDRYDVSRHSGDDALPDRLQYPAGETARRRRLPAMAMSGSSS